MLQPMTDHQRTGDGRVSQATAHHKPRMPGPLLRTLAAIMLAPVLPPLSVVIACGRDRHFHISLLLALVGYGVFQFLFAGPGLILWGFAVLHAVACAVLAVWPRRTLAAAE